MEAVWVVTLLLVVGAGLLVWFLRRPAGTTRPGPGGLAREVRENILQWRSLVEQEAERPGLSFSLVLAVIGKESAGQDGAEGRAGEIGLMQITQGAWQDYLSETNDPDVPTFEDAFPARLNIRVGSWYLSRKVEEMGSVRHGLRAYNCGTAGARRDPNCGAEYARSILEVFEPQLRSLPV